MNERFQSLSDIMMNIAVYCKCEKSSVYFSIAVFVQGNGEDSE